MKKLTLILLLFFTIQINYIYAWEWENYGPPGIKANKICYFQNSNVQAVICTDTGMFVMINGNDWEHYLVPYNDAISPGYESDSLLVIENTGSYSDRIRSFNIETGQNNIIEWCYKPNFIIANDSKTQFYVGYEYGLLFSEDGINWMDVPFFENKKCIDMEFFVVVTNEENNNTFFSEDNGTSWNQLEGSNISEIANTFNSIYGIVKGESWSSGFYEINENELKWDNIFYSVKLNAVGTNSAGIPFVGWYNSTSPDEGIAKYKNSELTFYNDGLLNLIINSISSPMIFGATVIYCCTDSGTYKRILSVGIQEISEPDNLSISPNPITNQTTIKLNLQETNGINNSISVYNNQGKIVDEIKIGTNSAREYEIKWDKGNLSRGVYYLLIKTGNESLSEKFIIL